MKIEFYIPEDETIPTKLRLKADGVDVYYKKCDCSIDGCFAYEFTLYNTTKDKADKIVDEIVLRMCRQSYDHGFEWEEMFRKDESENPIVITVYFRTKDIW